jgi:hypothetical protein
LRYVNETPSDALVEAASNGAYATWRGAPKYRLNNLAGDILAWRFIEIAELELLAFDQCIVFGAVFPGEHSELAGAARRDAVVRQARDVAWAVYAAYARRTNVERRLRFARELAAAVEGGTGSRGSLLPQALCDGDASVVEEANALFARLSEPARA